jgi:hypothetical protein
MMMKQLSLLMKLNIIFLTFEKNIEYEKVY